MFSYESRLQAYSVWDTMVFLLNGLVFILIGLQLRTIVTGLAGYSFPEAVGYALLISAVAVGCRIVWVFPGAYLPRWLSKRIRDREVNPRWQQVAVVSWAGMRGVVSLAGALALPNTLPNGEPFPARDLVLFITFIVILMTLVVQGLTLPLLIESLGVRQVIDEKQEERLLRRRMAQQAITHLEANHSAGSVHDEVLNYVKNEYELRITELNGTIRANGRPERPAELYQQAIRLQLEVIDVERTVLNEQRRSTPLDGEILRKLEQELDLESARLSSLQPAD